MATIKDVARLAGVSTSTASRAMHDNHMISEATKERVRQAMIELDYSPNFSAQNLANRKNNTIGIILPVRESQDSLGNNPFFMQMIQGISSICTDYRYIVSLATGRTEEELLVNVQNLIRSNRVEKFIFLCSKTDDVVFDFVKQEKVDCVVVGQSYVEDTGSTYFVDNDNRKAGQDVTKFLLEKGYQRITYAYTNMDELAQAERYMGYASESKAHHQRAQTHHLSRVDEEKNGHLLKNFLEKQQTQAFIACDDIMAVRLQRLFKKIGVESDCCAIIAFNNSMIAEIATPALTSVEVFPYELGEKAAEVIPYSSSNY
ncbi:LacI family DNA-binding transcriptional regulator [Streptococcus sp. X16XC17]|nr:LacI family DNA-binding transcriptional regulator [Streptococcus sp. X16XC17]